MANEKKLVVRFSAADQEVVSRALQSLGSEGERLASRLARLKEGPTASMKAIDASANELRGSLQGLTAGAGSLGNVLASLGPKGLAVGAAIGAVALGVKAGLRAFGEEERGLLRFEAVLKATGNAAGITTEQISEMSEKLERTTFIPKEDILQASAALSAFKAVSGDAFESTIKLAADMSEVFGGDVASNARLLGRALQDPAEGIDRLKRVAGELPEEVQKAAESLANAGKNAEAVQLILGELNGRIGGAATKAASGYAGTIDNIGDSFNDLLKISGTVADESGLLLYIKRITDGLNGMAEGLLFVINGWKQLYSLAAGPELPENASYARPQTVTGATFVDPTDRTNPINAELEKLAKQAELQRLKEKGLALPSKEDEEKAEKALNDALKTREGLLGRINDLELEGAAFKRGGKQEVEIQRQLNSFLAQTKGLRKDEVDTLAARYEQALRNKQLDEQLYEQQVKAEEELRKQREQALKPLEDAVERIQGAVADSFDNALSGGIDSFSDFWGEVKSISRRAIAEIAAAMVFTPVLGGLKTSFLSSVVGAGGSSGGAGGLGGGGSLGGGLLNAGSSIFSGLRSGFTSPILSPGIAFDIGQQFGLSADTVGALHQGLGNFTPLSGLASLGGNFLGNAIFGSNRGVGASIGGTIGGVAGTYFGGPIGGAIGSFLGNAVGGLFGGKQGVKHQDFYGTLGEAGTLSGVGYRTKNSGTEAAEALQQQFNTFFGTLGGMLQSEGKKFVETHVYGLFSSRAGNYLEVTPKDMETLRLALNTSNPDSLGAAFRDAAEYLLEASGVLSGEVYDALKSVDVAGKDAAEVLQAVADRFTYVMGLRQFADSLGSDPSLGNQSPEARYLQMKSAFEEVSTKASTQNIDIGIITAAAASFLEASKSYTGIASAFYSGDLTTVQEKLRYLADNPPRFAAGGSFSEGTFIVHPNELVMTSSTPGRVFNASETRQIIGGNQEAVAQAIGTLNQQFSSYRDQSAMQTMALEKKLGRMNDELDRMNTHLLRVASA